MRHCVIWLKKGLKFLLYMKIKSRERYDEPLKSIFVFWDIPENDFKKDRISAWYEVYLKREILCNSSVNFCLLRYSTTCLKKSWNFYFVSKLHQAVYITWFLSPFVLSETFWKRTLKRFEKSDRCENYIKLGILGNF